VRSCVSGARDWPTLAIVRGKPQERHATEHREYRDAVGHDNPKAGERHPMRDRIQDCASTGDEAYARHGSRECHRPAPFVLSRRTSSTMTARGGTNEMGNFFRGAIGFMGKELPV